MTARERPWMKFYPADWRADPLLRNCSLLARGLWMEMLALMHESDRYGYLLVNGKAPTDRQLAVQAGATVDEISAALAELESEGVFSRDHAGTIYSRRMKRDEKKSEIARKVGRKGGNPKLSNHKGNSAQDNREDKPQVNGGDKPHMPEARVQSTPKPPSLPTDVRSVMEEAGFISPPPDLSLLSEWYAEADRMFGQSKQQTLDQDVLPTIRRVKARLDRPPFKLKVFDAAIREKFAKDAADIAHLRRVAERNKPTAATG